MSPWCEGFRAMVRNCPKSAEDQSFACCLFVGRARCLWRVRLCARLLTSPIVTIPKCRKPGDVGASVRQQVPPPRFLHTPDGPDTAKPATPLLRSSGDRSSCVQSSGCLDGSWMHLPLSPTAVTLCGIACIPRNKCSAITGGTAVVIAATSKVNGAAVHARADLELRLRFCTAVLHGRFTQFELVSPIANVPCLSLPAVCRSGQLLAAT